MLWGLDGKCRLDTTHMTRETFEQLIAEAIAKIGPEPVTECILPLAKRYGWPIPRNKYEDVVRAVAIKFGQHRAQ